MIDPHAHRTPALVASERILAGSYLQVDRETFHTGSRTQIREIVRVRDGVGVLALTRDGLVPLVRQFRAAISTAMLEIPAGVLDEDETPLEAARRELAEEAGLSGGEWHHLRRYAQAEGYSSGWIDLFLALDCDVGRNHPEGDEELELTFHPMRELAAEMPFQDAKSMLAIQFARPILASRGIL